MAGSERDTQTTAAVLNPHAVKGTPGWSVLAEAGEEVIFVLNTALSRYAIFGIDAYACQSPDLAYGGCGTWIRTKIA